MPIGNTLIQKGKAAVISGLKNNEKIVRELSFRLNVAFGAVFYGKSLSFFCMADTAELPFADASHCNSVGTGFLLGENCQVAGFAGHVFYFEMLTVFKGDIRQFLAFINYLLVKSGK